MLSIECVTVMTALNSIVKIDARDAKGIGHTAFFPATYDVTTLNSYIAAMQGLDEVVEEKEKKPKKSTKEVKVETVPEIVVPEVVTPAAVLAPAVVPAMPLVAAQVFVPPVVAPPTPPPVVVPPVVPPVVAPVVPPVVVPPVVVPVVVTPPPAPAPMGQKFLGTGPTADPEAKAVVQRWAFEAIGLNEIPKSLYTPILTLNTQLREGNYPILINGEENAPIRQWYIQSLRAHANTPAL